MAEEGRLVVLIRSSATTYFQDRDGESAGFEYELVKAFAQDQGWDVEFEVYPSTESIIEFVDAGHGHLAAAGLSITEKRKKYLSFSKPYMQVDQKVVCGRNQRVKSPKDLAHLQLVVPPGTSHAELLQLLAEENSEIEFSLEAETSEAILERIWKDRDLCTVIDSNILDVYRRYFPELREVYTFPEKDEMAWVISKADNDLKKKADAWLTGAGRKKARLLINKYYGHVRDFDYYDTKKFLERIDTRLSQYRPFFEEAARQSRFTWPFLAAVAYQESQWDPKAVSSTGVRGIMMLTRATSEEVGVKDRLDPEQSILGGTRYLQSLYDRLPSYIPASQRKWYALAAYNVGYYHLRDAMGLAVVENKNPMLWVDIKEVLPLLAKRRYFKNLRYGYARGLEPVIYVSRIRNYHELLLNKIND